MGKRQLRRDALSEIGPEQTKEKSRVHTESSAATASSSTTITTTDALATNVEATQNYPVMDSEVPVTTTCSILGMVESTSTSPIAATVCLLSLVHVTPQGHLVQRAGLVKSTKGWLGQTKDLKERLKH